MVYSSLISLTAIAAAAAAALAVSAAPHVDTSIPAPGALGRRHVDILHSNSRRSHQQYQPASRLRRTRSTENTRSRSKRGSCKAKSTSTGSASNSQQTANAQYGVSASAGTGSVNASVSIGTTSTTTANSSSSAMSSNLGLGSGFMQKNGIYWGWLPDEGDAGGSPETMSQINGWMGGQKGAFYGWYAQAQAGHTFTGSQLTPHLSDIKASGAIFIASIMPTGGFSGYSGSDNSQAVNIAKVLKQLTDEGIEVWLRFAHEVNWYLQDGTYSGTIQQFQAAWAGVSAALDEYAPSVKMFFSPNVANLQVYEQYYPPSGRVDIIGIDYYPQKPGSFVSTMQPFHDKYCKEGGPYFAIGETGLGQAAAVSTRLQWAEEMTSAATAKALPYLLGVSWFNFYKGYDFRLADGTSATDSQTAGYFSS